MPQLLVEKPKEKHKEKTVIKIGKPTKVLVLNSSPKREKGNTALILNPFIEGMKEKGADVEIINLHDMNIVPCTGELYCWKITPGDCDYTDDMQILYPKIKKANVIVLAAPVYVGTINAKMKSVIDRMIPLLEPFMITAYDDTTSHHLRDGVNHAKVALISVGSHWEIESFDDVINYIETFCRYFSYKFTGYILRPHVSAIAPMLEDGKDLDHIFEAARTAGEEFIENGMISGDLADIVSEELMPREEYMKMVNKYFEDEIAKNKK